jgi:hypothetical protein
MLFLAKGRAKSTNYADHSTESDDLRLVEAESCDEAKKNFGTTNRSIIVITTLCLT